MFISPTSIVMFENQPFASISSQRMLAFCHFTLTLCPKK